MIKVQCFPHPSNTRLNDRRIKFEIDSDSGARKNFDVKGLCKRCVNPLYNLDLSCDCHYGADPNLLSRLAIIKLKLINVTKHFEQNLSSAESAATIELVSTIQMIQKTLCVWHVRNYVESFVLYFNQHWFV